MDDILKRAPVPLAAPILSADKPEQIAEMFNDCLSSNRFGSTKELIDTAVIAAVCIHRLETASTCMHKYALSNALRRLLEESPLSFGTKAGPALGIPRASRPLSDETYLRGLELFLSPKTFEHRRRHRFRAARLLLFPGPRLRRLES